MKKKKSLILIRTKHKQRILKNGLKLIQTEYKLGSKLCIDNLTAYSDIVNNFFRHVYTYSISTIDLLVIHVYAFMDIAHPKTGPDIGF